MMVVHNQLSRIQGKRAISANQRTCSEDHGNQSHCLPDRELGLSSSHVQKA